MCTPLASAVCPCYNAVMQTESVPAAPKHRGRYGLLNREEAASALGVSVKTLDALTRTGQLRVLRVSARGVRYWPKDLEAFVTGAKAEEER